MDTTNSSFSKHYADDNNRLGHTIVRFKSGNKDMKRFCKYYKTGVVILKPLIPGGSIHLTLPELCDMLLSIEGFVDSVKEFIFRSTEKDGAKEMAYSKRIFKKEIMPRNNIALGISRCYISKKYKLNLPNYTSYSLQEDSQIVEDDYIKYAIYFENNSEFISSISIIDPELFILLLKFDGRSVEKALDLPRGYAVSCSQIYSKSFYITIWNYPKYFKR